MSMTLEDREELKDAIEKMKQVPWDYGNLRDCAACGGNDLSITEFDDGNFNFRCVSVECKKCGKFVEEDHRPADKKWGRK